MNWSARAVACQLRYTLCHSVARAFRAIASCPGELCVSDRRLVRYASDPSLSAHTHKYVLSRVGVVA
jgi:hypothetical protein